MNNENFILQIRNMISALDQIRQIVNPEIQKLEETVKRLEDQSHLGTIAVSDFGLEDQTTALANVRKQINKVMRTMKSLSEDLEESQNKKMAETSGVMTDQVDTK